MCLTLPKKCPHTWARDCTVLVSILSPDPLLPLGRASPWFSGSHSQCSPRTARVLCHSWCPHTITWSQLSTLPASTCGQACSSTATHILEQRVFQSQHSCAIGDHREEEVSEGTCAWALQAVLPVAHMATDLRSLEMCASLLAGWYGPYVLFSVGLILNGLEPNSKGRSLAAAAWLKQSNSQGRGFGIHR